MKKFMVALLGALVSMAAHAELKVGERPPDFSLPGTDGKQYTLSQLQGKHVVIAFFPKAYTSG